MQGNGMSTTVTKSGSNWVIKATGCPDYDWSQQKTPNDANYQNWVFTFPITPTFSTSKLYVGRMGAGNSTNNNKVMVSRLSSML